MTNSAARAQRHAAPAEEPESASRTQGEKTQTYSSPAIRARRRRILDETRRMIAEHGLTNFNMNELCQRAGVAKRTLYNAFQTKERMIAIAINEYFQEYIDRISYSAPVGTLQRNLERLISVSHRNVRIRNYTGAIMSIYFSPEVNPDIWQTMQSMATRPTLDWLEILAARGELQPGVDAEQLAADVVRYEYATVNDWAQGRIPDDQLAYRLVTSYLTFMAGATRGAANAEIAANVAQIRANGVPKIPAAPATATNSG